MESLPSGMRGGLEGGGRNNYGFPSVPAYHQPRVCSIYGLEVSGEILILRRETKGIKFDEPTEVSMHLIEVSERCLSRPDLSIALHSIFIRVFQTN